MFIKTVKRKTINDNNIVAKPKSKRKYEPLIENK